MKILSAPTPGDLLTARQVLCFIRRHGVEIEGKRYKGIAGVMRFVWGALRSCP